ncbi:monovalent cation/H+ antiporter complex subunit F [Streptomyces macrosporus]|uniref:Sodium:proton antiporter n=1 Tax=Streptomyces macrosporus TaxID=44032 RepID=A0ABP5WDZ0_9ACTN
MSAVAVVALALLSAVGMLVLVRLVRGPRALDRIVALEVLVSLVVAGACVGIAVWEYTTFAPVLIVLALLGFIGSTAAARLIGEREDLR